ncbi:MAG: SPOR domain-containing protein, partial [Candidatus Eisenbacteria bacterium]
KSLPREEPKAKEAKPVKPVKQVTEFAIVLPGYQSMDGAQSELKALQLLGFRVKDATIVANESGSYSIRLAQMKSKASAEEMASSLARMSFRAVVQTVQR